MFNGGKEGQVITSGTIQVPYAVVREATNTSSNDGVS